jgi:hypothetical protein
MARRSRGRPSIFGSSWVKAGDTGDRTATLRGRAKRRRNGLGTTLLSREALCVLTGISNAQLTLWEHEELIAPATSKFSSGPELLYDESMLQRVRLIRTLAEELEVNLPGIDVILHLLDQIAR